MGAQARPEEPPGSGLRAGAAPGQLAKATTKDSWVGE
jgi:hypothetical protein